MLETNTMRARSDGGERVGYWVGVGWDLPFNLDFYYI